MTNVPIFKMFLDETTHDTNAITDNDIQSFITSLHTLGPEGRELMFFLIYCYKYYKKGIFPVTTIPFNGKRNTPNDFKWDFKIFPVELQRILILASRKHRDVIKGVKK